LLAPWLDLTDADIPSFQIGTLRDFRRLAERTKILFKKTTVATLPFLAD